MNSDLLIGRLGNATPLKPSGSPPRTAKPAEPGFDGFLTQALFRPVSRGIVVSAHAEKRLSERSIVLGPDLQQALTQALDELGRKGARDSLIVTKEGAFVVNVPTRTLVTAMNPVEMENRIITQIDSVSLRTG